MRRHPTGPRPQYQTPEPRGGRKRADPFDPTTARKPGERYSPDEAGVFLEPRPGTDDTVVTVAVRAVALAVERGMALPQWARPVLAGATVPRTSGAKKRWYEVLREALDYLTDNYAPPDYAFAFERGQLILRKRGPFLDADDVGVLYQCKPEAGQDERWVGLQVLVLAKWCGMPSDVDWEFEAWNADYALKYFWRKFPTEAMLDEADAAIDWLNENACSEGCEFQLTEDFSFGLFRRGGGGG